MSDRAAVDEYRPKPDEDGDWEWSESEPRALVALSEDRQWLVVLTPGEYSWRSFGIWHREWDRHWGFKPRGEWIWRRVGGVKDTGQDAHEVLAQVRAGKGE